MRLAAVAARLTYAIFLAAIGLWLASLGLLLIRAGGTPYYLALGAALCVVALWILRQDRRSAAGFALILGATLIWSLAEVGLDPLALAPRLGLLTALALPLVAVGAYGRWVVATLGAILATMLVAALVPRSTIPSSGAAITAAVPGDRFAGADWASYGGDAGGSRFSTLRQIDPRNVSGLAPAWIYRTGAASGALPLTFEATPLAIAGRLYFCTGRGEAIALDGETGRQLWRYDSHLNRTGVLIGTCRGVVYARTAADPGTCHERIIFGTMDARLIALDANDGRPCADFGNRGSVDLSAGMGGIEAGYYGVTSAPQLVRGRIVVGGWITDGQHIGEPPGVVRAFDAVSGRLAWAFDAGSPDRHGAQPEGRYTRGTPNSWAPMSADARLGLVYIPTGNATPDYYGGERTANDDRFSSAVVALDAGTGAVRWIFQTTHHDLWDYDVTAQPTLLEWRVRGGTIPALVQATKRGELFIVDRRTGRPLTSTREVRAPPSAVLGERAAPTQPYSTGIPSLAGPPLHEADMWGITPIDQAWCRIAFRHARYDGPFTPPGLDKPSLIYPGYGGGVEWGGVSIDPLRQILVANSNRVADTVQLLTRAEARRRGITPLTVHSREGAAGAVAQQGVPYAADLKPFLSPLRIPCQRPPWGMVTAIDLRTRQLLWDRPFGTGRDSGPLGIPSGLPFTIGVPNTGGSIETASGLTFIGASYDRYLRAFDTQSGRELARFRLPAGGQATPMTYLAGHDQRQFVVIAAGGSPGLGTKLGDYVVAYALPLRGH
jgi:quinoprotein glucose dehydrogenase